MQEKLEKTIHQKHTFFPIAIQIIFFRYKVNHKQHIDHRRLDSDNSAIKCPEYSLLDSVPCKYSLQFSLCHKFYGIYLQHSSDESEPSYGSS